MPGLTRFRYAGTNGLLLRQVVSKDLRINDVQIAYSTNIITSLPRSAEDEAEYSSIEAHGLVGIFVPHILAS